MENETLLRKQFPSARTVSKLGCLLDGKSCRSLYSECARPPSCAIEVYGYFSCVCFKSFDT
jgi:hypothetical protein